MVTSYDGGARVHFIVHLIEQSPGGICELVGFRRCTQEEEFNAVLVYYQEYELIEGKLLFNILSCCLSNL